MSIAVPFSSPPVRPRKSFDGRPPCNSLFSSAGEHEMTRIRGTPRSEMTYRGCAHPGCGYEEERGVGAFYGQPEPETWTAQAERRIAALEQKLAALGEPHA